MQLVNFDLIILSFCLTCSGTKQAAHRLKILFGLAGFKAAELHGNLTQVQRLDVSYYLLTCMMVGIIKS